MAVNWLERSKADPTAWLLAQDDPMVRYRTLTWILERPERDPEVEAARREAALHPRLDTLLAGQNAGGWWEDPAHFAHDYYYGTAWRLYLAAQLGAVRSPAIDKAVEYLFRYSQSRDGGGFSHDGSGERGGSVGGEWTCLTGAMVEMLFHFGYASDPRTERALGFLLSRQKGDGLYPCQNFKTNSSTLPFHCYIGSVKPLLAVLSMPRRLVTPSLRILTERTSKTLLSYGIVRYKRSPSGESAAKKEWLQFGFPRFWNTDVLEVAWILTRLGHGSHPALAPILKLILARQLKNGKWKLEFDYNHRTPIPIGKLNTGSPWITLRAYHTLKLASRIPERRGIRAGTD